MDLYLRLLPKGKFASMGYYNHMSRRSLQFQICIETRTRKNYETLQKSPMACLSICGATHRGGANCQQQEAIKSYRDRVPPAELCDFDRLLSIWDTYHLNDLTSGTITQEEALSEWKKSNKYDYAAACKYLESLGILEDRGYKYGTGWLCKPVPQEDIDFLLSLNTKWKESDLLD